MSKRKSAFLFVLITSLICFMSATSVIAVIPDVDPFPIGIFWTPNPENTTAAKYQEIKDMNATYVLMSNGVKTQAQNDTAMSLCATKGLKGVVSDMRLTAKLTPVNQIVTGSGSYVSQSNSLGQTFTSPAGVYLSISSIQLYIDKTQWPSGVTLTLSVYNSPSKTTLIGSSSITGPVDTYYPTWNLDKGISQNTTYYMELTSSSTANIGWVVRSTSNSYSGGTAYEHGVALSSFDFWFKMVFSDRMYCLESQPAITDIDAVASHYKTNSALLGYNVVDEPQVNELPRVQSTMERLRQEDPNHISYVNLFPSYASTDQLGFGTPNGGYVTPSCALGQTFKTNSITTIISTIQLYMDKNQWGTNEPLTLKLWNSTAKTVLKGQCTLSGSSTNWPQFTLNVTVSPNTTYYWELTHGGGGDNSVGWVIRSSDGVDWDKDGTAYIAGASINADHWFTINQNITAFSYEDYVYRWVSKKPDFLMYDHYPFRESGGFSSDYYTNMEIIRRQALMASVDFWTYIQSVGISPSFRSPSQKDMRYQVYTSLAYGAKGINYFTYVTPVGEGESFHDGIILPDGTKSALYTYAQGINAEVLKLGPTLKILTSQTVYHTGTLPASTTVLPSDFFWKPTDTNQPLVIGYFKNSSGRKYIMVVNRDYSNSRTVSFTVSPKPTTVKEVSKTTGAEVSTNYDLPSGTLSAFFAAGEGRLYVLPEGY